MGYASNNYRRIKKNRKDSPLFQLAPEIRENILAHLVGDKLIHIKYLDGHDMYQADKVKNQHLDMVAFDEMPDLITLTSDDDDLDMDIPMTLAMREQSPQSGFRHAICTAKQSEQSAYQDAISGNTIVPEGESPELYVASCEKRHGACKMCGEGPMFLAHEDQQALRLDLNVLGVCRQLYEEANHRLWYTNTFSFDDPRSFEKFFLSLNPAQKRNLARIHISAVIAGYGSIHTSAYQRARWDSNYWGKALKISNLTMLRGVQTLHLCINQGFGCISSHSDDPAEQQLKEGQQADMEFFLRLRVLSVKHVTVVVSDDAGKLEEDGMSAHRWTAIKKIEYAESIRVQLVDPSGADLVKTQAEATNLARNTKIRDSASLRLQHWKRILKNIHADVVRTTKMASREEARAVLAVQNADRVSKKISNKAVKLRQDAEEQKKIAADIRKVANIAVDREKFWQEKVGQAKEKYKRAMVRLGATPEFLLDEEEADLLIEGWNDSNRNIGNVDVARSEDDELLVSDPEEEASDEEDDAAQSEDDELLVHGPEEGTSYEDDEVSS